MKTCKFVGLHFDQGCFKFYISSENGIHFLTRGLTFHLGLVLSGFQVPQSAENSRTQRNPVHAESLSE